MCTNQSTGTQPNEPTWKVWKTIKLGRGIKDADSFRKAIKDSGMRISDWANDILGKPQFRVAQETTEVKLVIVSVAELGFKDGAKLEDIYAAAKKGGLELCPNEVGPQLRLQYKDQPFGEWLVIGMEPILDSGRRLKLFYVGHRANGQWLLSYYDYPGDYWVADYRLVFVLARQ